MYRGNEHKVPMQASKGVEHFVNRGASLSRRHPSSTCTYDSHSLVFPDSVVPLGDNASKRRSKGPLGGNVGAVTPADKTDEGDEHCWNLGVGFVRTFLNCMLVVVFSDSCVEYVEAKVSAGIVTAFAARIICYRGTSRLTGS